MYGLGDDFRELYEDIETRDKEIKQLRKALKAIIDIEEGCKKRGVGYDIGVHNIAIQAYY